MNFEFGTDFVSYSHSDELSAELTHKGTFLLQINQNTEQGSMDLAFYNPVLDNEVFKGKLDLLPFIKQMFAAINDLNPDFFRDHIKNNDTLWNHGKE